MATMVSSSQSKLLCPIRGVFVAATPEERVRQTLIASMIEDLGYPRGLLAVEKELAQLPHVTKRAHLPTRRADIICFMPQTLLPLLLVECKEGIMNEQAQEQAKGYNLYVQARFLAIADKQGVHLLNPPTPFLPSYAELLEAAKR